jgi:hypothetical protein
MIWKAMDAHSIYNGSIRLKDGHRVVQGLWERGASAFVDLEWCRGYESPLVVIWQQALPIKKLRLTSTQSLG